MIETLQLIFCILLHLRMTAFTFHILILSIQTRAKCISEIIYSAKTYWKNNKNDIIFRVIKSFVGDNHGMEKIFLKGGALSLARHGEGFLIFVGIALTAVCLWLLWLAWGRRARIASFILWFVGIKENTPPHSTRTHKRGGLIVLFLDIVALALSLLSTLAFSVVAVMFIYAPLFLVHAFVFWFPVIVQNVLGVFFGVISALVILFVVPRMWRRIFRFVHSRYLE